MHMWFWLLLRVGVLCVVWCVSLVQLVYPVCVCMNSLIWLDNIILLNSSNWVGRVYILQWLYVCMSMYNYTYGNSVWIWVCISKMVRQLRIYYDVTWHQIMDEYVFMNIIKSCILYCWLNGFLVFVENQLFRGINWSKPIV